MKTSLQNNHIQTAMIMMTIAMLFMPIVDSIAKWMSDSIPAGQVTWGRFLFQTLLMLPFVLRLPGKLFISGVLVHIARGTTLAVATLLFFAALKFLPIADAIAIFFVEPLLVTLLAAVFLKEKVGWRRLSAISVGLIGAQLIIRPNFEQFGWPAALPLGAALSFAFYILLTRSVSQREDPVAMQFYAGFFGFIFMSVALLLGDNFSVPALSAFWPTSFEWLLLFIVGLIATVAHFLVVQSFKHAPVSVLAPFQYLEIISATILGLVIFGDFPDRLTWTGITIIIASGLFVFHCERKT